MDLLTFRKYLLNLKFIKNKSNKYRICFKYIQYFSLGIHLEMCTVMKRVRLFALVIKLFLKAIYQNTYCTLLLLSDMFLIRILHLMLLYFHYYWTKNNYGIHNTEINNYGKQQLCFLLFIIIIYYYWFILSWQIYRLFRIKIYNVE